MVAKGPAGFKLRKGGQRDVKVLACRQGGSTAGRVPAKAAAPAACLSAALSTAACIMIHPIACGQAWQAQRGCPSRQLLRKSLSSHRSRQSNSLSQQWPVTCGHVGHAPHSGAKLVKEDVPLGGESARICMGNTNGKESCGTLKRRIAVSPHWEEKPKPRASASGEATHSVVLGLTVGGAALCAPAPLLIKP